MIQEQSLAEVMKVSGSKIRQARKALKAATNGRQGSQAWLAAQIGAHVTSVSDWERGANQPSPRHLKAIASALGVSVDSLYEDDGDAGDGASEPTTREAELLEALKPFAKLIAAAERAA